jgi:hypothetical protein
MVYNMQKKVVLAFLDGCVQCAACVSLGSYCTVALVRAHLGIVSWRRSVGGYRMFLFYLIHQFLGSKKS